jgi:phosphoribosylformylglycinamidine synthase
MSLTDQELLYLEQNLKRKANNVELSMVSAEWSEHCSYKSSKAYLKLLPMKGKYIVNNNYDTTLLDIGNDYLLTIHIESHNHPSAVEPYGGAATGVGGIVRDILSVGAKPIALLNALRFGSINSHTKWLFRNVVRGIADYGNCIGIPTIGGEVEFDPSFDNYCLVDVSCIGLIKREDLLINEVNEGDYVILAGNSTGRDGIHGASFASKVLEEDRSAVQIPDPFMEKLLIDATLEAIHEHIIKVMKDLGGGGLACALSETADKFKKGMDIMLEKVHLREDLLPEEIIISESQERMLYIIDKSNLDKFRSIFEKYNIPYNIIGIITNSNNLKIRYNDYIIADISASLVANAPLIERISKRPKYIDDLINIKKPDIQDLKSIILRLLEDPNIASKSWVYEQYDHEVGLRTVIKPGMDSSIIRLYDNKLLAIKLDGNSKHVYLDPYNGTMGIFAECCRNIVSFGAEPIGMVDHLQFGNPEDPEVFYTFIEAIKGLRDYSLALNIPCVGGKVSLYNTTKYGNIKPSPVVGVIGLLDNIINYKIESNDKILLTSITRDELGGSEYYEYIHNIIGGKVPHPNPSLDKKLYNAIRSIISKGLINSIHDCSKGGLAIALAELCIINDIGASIDTKLILNECNRLDDLLFSESHSRFIMAISDKSVNDVKTILNANDIPYSIIGSFKGNKISFDDISIEVSEARYAYNSIERLLEHG